LLYGAGHDEARDPVPELVAQRLMAAARASSCTLAAPMEAAFFMS
jgi:hypothetical protein